MGITLTYPKISRFAPARTVDWLWKGYRTNKRRDGEGKIHGDKKMTRCEWDDDVGLDEGGGGGASIAGKLAYSRPFLLRLHDASGNSEEKYLSGVEKRGGGYACAHGAVMQTSLLTFHGLKGVAHNRDNPTGNLRFVNNSDGVTLYANIKDGRYLAPLSRSSANMSFATTFESISDDCLFTVRRVSGGRRQRRSALRFGDVVTLEHVSRKGFFVGPHAAATGKGKYAAAKLSSSSLGTYVICAPTLLQLVKLSGTRNDGRSDANARGMRRSDSAIYDNLQRLPLELVYHILSFKGNWVRTARLVSKNWRAAAEMHIAKIRVNGNWAFLNNEKTRRSMVTFVTRCRYLRSLIFRNIDDLTDEEACLLRSNTALIHLSLGGCSNVTDYALCNGICRLGQLRSLNLAATRITDASIAMIAEHLQSLYRLNLYGCKGITAQGVARLITMPNLKSVNLRGTNIEKAQTVDLRMRAKKIEVLTGPIIWGSIY